MGEAIMYDAYVEVQGDGACLAQLSDLQGCFAQGPTQAQALIALAAAITPYYAWLRRHDDYTPDVRGPFEVRAREVVQVAAADGHHDASFFTPDGEPMGNEDLDWSLALLDWAYSDIAVGSEADAALDHLTQTQLWLISRIEAQPAVPRIEQLPGDARQRMRQVWQASLARLRGASDDERQHIVEHDGERWSLRKVLRRSILHVRMHAATQ